MRYNNTEGLSRLVDMALGEVNAATEARAFQNSILEKLRNFLKTLEENAEVDSVKIDSHNSHIWNIKNLIDEKLDVKLRAKVALSAEERAFAALSKGIKDNALKSSLPKATLYNCTMYVQDWLQQHDALYRRTNLRLIETLGGNQLANSAKTPIMSQTKPEEESEMRNPKLKTVSSPMLKSAPAKPITPEKREREEAVLDESSKKISPERKDLRTKAAAEEQANKLSAPIKHAIQKALADLYEQHKDKKTIIKNNVGLLAFSPKAAFYNTLHTGEVEYVLYIDSGDYALNKEIHDAILPLTVGRSHKPNTRSQVIFMAQDSDDWKDKCTVEMNHQKFQIPNDGKSPGTIIVFGSFIARLMEMFPPSAENVLSNNTVENPAENPGATPILRHDNSGLDLPSEFSFGDLETTGVGAAIDLDNDPAILALLEKLKAKKEEDARLREEEATVQKELYVEERKKQLFEQLKLLERETTKRRESVESQKRTLAAIRSGIGTFVKPESDKATTAEPAQKRANVDNAAEAPKPGL